MLKKTLQSGFVIYLKYQKDLKEIRKGANRSENLKVETSTEELEKQARRKRKERFISKVMNNDFNYFITLTYNPEKYNNETFYRSVKWHFRIKYNNYILVWEKHKNGRLHCHALTDNIPYETYKAKYKKKTHIKTKHIKWGLYNIQPIYNKIATMYYLSKYLTKDMSLKNTYSKNLVDYENIQEMYNLIETKKYYTYKNKIFKIFI